jgi:ketosteroid isomerase-like protein
MSPFRTSSFRLFSTLTLLIFGGGPSAIRAAELAAAERAARTETARAAEVAFAGSVESGDPVAFAAAIDEQAVFVDASGPTRGRAAITAAWAPLLAPDRPDFRWHPELVELSGDGTLALSRGPWTMKAKRADGVVVERGGTFNSIWRRQADGSWRIVFDAGCPPCPACGV